jgi:hypothetical protein
MELRRNSNLYHATNSPWLYELYGNNRYPIWFFSDPPTTILTEMLYKRLDNKRHEQDEYERVLWYKIDGDVREHFIFNVNEELRNLCENSTVFDDLNPNGTESVSSIIAYLHQNEDNNRMSIIDRFPRYQNRIIAYYKSQGYNCISEPYAEGISMVCVLSPIIKFVKAIESTEYYRDLVSAHD